MENKTILMRYAGNNNDYFRLSWSEDGFPVYEQIGSLSGWGLSEFNEEYFKRWGGTVNYCQLWEARDEEGKVLMTDMFVEHKGDPSWERYIKIRMELGWKRSRQLPEKYWHTEQEWLDILKKYPRT